MEYITHKSPININLKISTINFLKDYLFIYLF